MESTKDSMMNIGGARIKLLLSIGKQRGKFGSDGWHEWANVKSRMAVFTMRKRMLVRYVMKTVRTKSRGSMLIIRR
jgi:hypothetical protein